MEKNAQGLSAWQLTMMALGTVIGGSFFLGSAIAIRAAGPSVIISFILGGILVYFILFALSEMTAADAAPGSFRTFAEQVFGPGVGFVVGWVYWTGLVLAMSSEAIAVSVFFRTWFPGVPLWLLASLIVIGVTLLNLLGADKLSKLESGLALIKLLAIAGFIVLGFVLIIGLVPGIPRVGAGALTAEKWFPGGIGGIAGSMLIVMFAYAGFEVIGLAASETSESHKIVPRAIAYTVLGLLILYIGAAVILLPLIPTNLLTTNQSPFVLALTRWGLGWAGSVITIVLITAIISTMLAAMFGLGRMTRSLTDEGHAPAWLKDRGDIPYRGIIFSGAAMLGALWLSFLLPRQVYLFLVSSGGFSLLFVYLVILVTHYKFRKQCGCPPNGRCQLRGYPYTSWFAILSLIVIILSMPLIPGQGAGLLAGLALVVFYAGIYLLIARRAARMAGHEKREDGFGGLADKLTALQPEMTMEAAAELNPENKDKREGDCTEQHKNRE